MPILTCELEAQAAGTGAVDADGRERRHGLCRHLGRPAACVQLDVVRRKENDVRLIQTERDAAVSALKPGVALATADDPVQVERVVTAKVGLGLAVGEAERLHVTTALQ